MLSALLGLSGLFGTLGGKLFDWLQTRANNQEQTTLAAVEAATKVSHDEFAWPEVRWMIAFTIGAFNLHLWAVVLDTVFKMNWQIAKLPAPMDTWEGSVLIAPFAAAGLLGVVKRIMK